MLTTKTNRWRKTLLTFFGFLCSWSLYGTDSLRYFSAKADIEFAIENGSKESFTTHIRYSSGDTLWMSMTGTLGIEGMRILVTQDTTYILNKIEKTATKYANNEPNPFFPISLALSDWKMILIQLAYPIDSTTLILRQEDSMIYTYYCPIFDKKLYLDSDNNMFKAEILGNDLRGTIYFSEFKPLIGSKKLPYKIQFDMLKESNIWTMNIHYNQHKVNQRAAMPFDFGKYSRE